MIAHGCKCTGAVAAWIIGTLHLLAGPQFGLTLIVFFFSSSKVLFDRLSIHQRMRHHQVLEGRTYLA